MTYLLLCVQYQTPDDGQRYCPKRVESYSKYKFEKLVLLVGSEKQPCALLRLHKPRKSFSGDDADKRKIQI